ncbi:MAG UNVERIFIED_CONTAM: hypothetical protein LOD86_02330 [Thermobifida fusca]
MRTRHLPEVKKTRGEWVMDCTCGERGEGRATRRMARADQDAHLIRVCDVPPGERCQMPKQHRLRPWERCFLCANQLPMFGLEDVS